MTVDQFPLTASTSAPPERSALVPSTRQAVVALLITDLDAAALAGISRSHLHRLRAGGHFGPRPIKLGRALRFDRQEVIAWIAARCPDARTWAAMQAAESRRARREVS